MKSKKRFHREFKQQSMGIAVVLLLVASAFVFTLLSTPTITGAATIQSISLLRAGQSFDMAVKNVKGVQQATFQFEETVKNVVITIDDKVGSFPGKAYSQFEITFTIQPKISSLLLRLKIKEQDLLSQGIAIEDVRLYVDGTELPTTLTQKKDDYVYYTATTRALGRFVIGKKVVTPKPEIVTPKIIEPAPAEPEVIPTLVEEQAQPLVEEAIQQPETRLSLWATIVLFFKNLFS